MEEFDMSAKPPDSDSSSVLPLLSASSNHVNPYNEKSHESILAIHHEMNEFMVSQGEIQKQLLHVVNEQAKQLQVAVKHITDTSSNVKAELVSMIEKAITKRFSEIGGFISKRVKTDIETMFRSAALCPTEQFTQMQKTKRHKQALQKEMKRQLTDVVNEQLKPLEMAIERMKETVSAGIKRGPSDKAALEKSFDSEIKKNISRDIEAHLETCVRQALKDLEYSVIHYLESSWKTMPEETNAVNERFNDHLFMIDEALDIARGISRELTKTLKSYSQILEARSSIEETLLILEKQEELDRQRNQSLIGCLGN